MAEEARVEHQGVLCDEVVRALCTRPDGAYVDCTFGRGGHARALLAALGPQARLLVIDRDPLAVRGAANLAREDGRVVVRHGTFADLAAIALEAGFRPAWGVLMDLGVSSPQLDDPARGFSFRLDGPLDMRMDPERGESAAAWLARASAEELEQVFREFGEERHARRIARAIVARRQEAPLTRTLELAALIEAQQPRPDPRKHAATRVFQAIRIHVNAELEALKAGLEAAFEILAPAGRLAVVTFHSLEDRIVKQAFARWAGGAPVPRRLPVRGVAPSRARVVGRSQTPSPAELDRNPRARSARLRLLEKVA
jgi:16S rRNA (cytosine1402-N4)-methyltransferase